MFTSFLYIMLAITLLISFLTFAILAIKGIIKYYMQQKRGKSLRQEELQKMKLEDL